MKHFLNLLLSTAILFGSAGMPVFAADTNENNIVTLEPLYPFDMPIAGSVSIHIPEEVYVSEIQVIQSSPENDALLIYQAADISASQLDLPLENGNYRIHIRSNSLDDKVRDTTASISLIVENPDFKPSLKNTVCDIYLSNQEASYAEYSTRKAEDSFDPESGIQHYVHEICFFRHEGIFGDMNADNTVNADDANIVLKLYLETLLDPSYTATTYDIIHGDYDENGYLTADDSNAILSYYLGKMLSPDLTWDSLKTI